MNANTKLVETLCTLFPEQLSKRHARRLVDAVLDAVAEDARPLRAARCRTCHSRFLAEQHGGGLVCQQCERVQ